LQRSEITLDTGVPESTIFVGAGVNFHFVQEPDIKFY